MALDFFRGVAGNIAAKGAALLPGDQTDYEREQTRQREEEAERKRQEEETLRQAREAQAQQLAEARKAQARSWLEAATAAAQEKTQAAAAAAGEAASGLGTAVRGGLDEAGALKDEARQALGAAVSGVAEPVKGSYGAGDRWLAERGPAQDIVSGRKPVVEAADFAGMEREGRETLGLGAPAAATPEEAAKYEPPRQGPASDFLRGVVQAPSLGGVSLSDIVTGMPRAGRQVAESVDTARGGLQEIKEAATAPELTPQQRAEKAGRGATGAVLGGLGATAGVAGTLYGAPIGARLEEAARPFGPGVAQGARTLGEVGGAFAAPMGGLGEISRLRAAEEALEGLPKLGGAVPAVARLLGGAGRLAERAQASPTMRLGGRAYEEALKLEGPTRETMEAAGRLRTLGTGAGLAAAPPAMATKRVLEARERARAEGREPGFGEQAMAGLAGAVEGADIGTMPGDVADVLTGAARRGAGPARAAQRTAGGIGQQALRLAREEAGTVGPPTPPTPEEAPRRSRQQMQAELAEAAKAVRAAGVNPSQGPGVDATPEQTAAWQRFTQAKTDASGRAQQAVAAPEPTAQALAARRVAPAGEGLAPLEQRIAEERAAPGPVARTTTRGQPLLQTAADPDRPFFSQLERALADPRVQQAAASGDAQAVNRRLREAGVTQEEMRWTGTEDLLADAQANGLPVTPEQLQDWVTENRAEVVEVALGTDPAKVSALSDLMNAHATARHEQTQATQAVEQEFIRALVDAGVYAPMPQEITLPEGTDPVDLRYEQAMLRQRQNEWLRYMRRAAEKHMQAARLLQEGADPDGSIPPDVARLVERTNNDAAMGSGQDDYARWLTDPGLRQALQDTAQDYAWQIAEAHEQHQARVNEAEAAAQAAIADLHGEPGALTSFGQRNPSPAAPRWPTYSSAKVGMGDYGSAAGYREFVVLVPPQTYAGRAMQPGYAHGHWEGLQNPVLHVRTTVRSLPNGMRVLYVEEIQTDLHQAAREPQRSRSGRPLVDAEGKKIPVGYVPFGQGVGAGHPAVQARQALHQAVRAAEAAWRATEPPLREWRMAPAGVNASGDPWSKQQAWERDAGVRFWKDHFTALRMAWATTQAPRGPRNSILMPEWERPPQIDAQLREMAAANDQVLRENAEREAQRQADWAQGERYYNYGSGEKRGTEDLERFLALRDELYGLTEARARAEQAFRNADHALQASGSPEDLDADVYIQAQASTEASRAFQAAQQAVDDWSACAPRRPAGAGHARNHRGVGGPEGHAGRGPGPPPHGAGAPVRPLGAGGPQPGCPPPGGALQGHLGPGGPQAHAAGRRGRGPGRHRPHQRGGRRGARGRRPAHQRDQRHGRPGRQQRRVRREHLRHQRRPPPGVVDGGRAAPARRGRHGPDPARPGQRRPGPLRRRGPRPPGRGLGAGRGGLLQPVGRYPAGMGGLPRQLRHRRLRRHQQRRWPPRADGRARDRGRPVDRQHQPDQVVQRGRTQRRRAPGPAPGRGAVRVPGRCARLLPVRQRAGAVPRHPPGRGPRREAAPRRLPPLHRGPAAPG